MPNRTPNYLFILLVVVVGAFLGSVFTLHMTRNDSSPVIATPTYASPATPAATPPTVRVTGDADAVVKVVEKVGPAVVNIDTLARAYHGNMYYPYGNRDASSFYRKGSGSGVIVSADGYILTNAHVVRGADAIKVRLLDERTFEGRIAGSLRGLDLAIIKIDAKSLPFAELGDSDAARIGEWVVALGNPLGFDHTVTVGVLSGRGRKLDDMYRDLLQTDAAINPGNSGGALVDLEGKVIGINTAVVASAQGIGFAIPANLARNAVEQVVATGKIRIPYIGVRMVDMNARIAEYLKVPVTHGVAVAGVVEGSPADAAGLRERDVIVSAGGKKIESSGALMNFLQSRKVGEAVELGVYRDGKKLPVTVTVGELDRMPEE